VNPTEPESLRLYIAEIFSSRFFYEYRYDESVDNIKDMDHIYAFELSPKKAITEEDEEKEVEEKKEEVEERDSGYTYVQGSSSYYYNSSSSRRSNLPFGKDDDGEVHIRLLNQRKVEIRSYSYQYSSYNSTRKELFATPVMVSVPRNISYKRLYVAVLRQLEYVWSSFDDIEEHIAKVEKLIASEESGEEEKVTLLSSSGRASSLLKSSDTEKDGEEKGEEKEDEEEKVKEGEDGEGADDGEEKTEKDNEAPLDESVEGDYADGDDHIEPLFEMSITNGMGTTEEAELIDNGAEPTLPSQPRPIYISVLWQTRVHVLT
tara:strand:- start:713 stop:1666 length:954 start_codon:yes stop_codon:yes gene_type:complete